MSGCCDARGCDGFFDERLARRAAERYRRRGLDRVSRRVVELASRGRVGGSSVLEVGGGVGELQVELLQRSAASAVNLELSPAYGGEAVRLLREHALEARGEWRLHDLAADPTPVEPADLVVLNRVVCCYPDALQLVAAAAARTRRLLVLSYPRRNALTRAFVAAQNLGFRLRGREFRTFTHPPRELVAAAEAEGLRLAGEHRGAIWLVTALARD